MKARTIIGVIAGLALTLGGPTSIALADDAPVTTPAPVTSSDPTAPDTTAPAAETPAPNPTTTDAPADPAPAATPDPATIPPVTFAAAVTTASVELPAPTTYVVNAWKLGPLSTPGNYDASTLNGTTAFLDDQHVFATADPDVTVDLNALDSALTVGCYQIDGYVNDDTTTALLAGGVLHAPNNPQENLAFGAPGVDGNPWKFVCIPPAPVSCEATGTSYTEDVDWATGQFGRVLAGPSVPAIDHYYGVTGNLQGLASFSITETTTGPVGESALGVIEVNPHGSAYPGGPSIGYETLSPLGPNSDGATNEFAGDWYSSKIPYATTGGQGSPQPLSWFITNQPNNTLISFGVHLQTNSTAVTSTVTALNTDCLNEDYVPVQPRDLVTKDKSHTVDCGENTITYTVVVTHEPYIWSDESASYVLDENSEDWTVHTYSHTKDLNAEQTAHGCAMPVAPTYTDNVCGSSADVTTDAVTEGITYTDTTDTTTNVVTTNATANEGYTLAPDAQTVWVHQFVVTVCPTSNNLAFTGTDKPTVSGWQTEGWVAFALFILGTGALVARYIYRRHTA